MKDFVLRPLTKEVALFLIHYETSEEAHHKIISEAFDQFRKNFTKRLGYLKKQFEEEDWELIHSSHSFVSYFL